MMVSSNKFKEKWDYEKFSFEGNHSSCGLTWPPKNYNCSFCNREFKSAQALGGHMNVHRRDRARLRLLPPPVLEYRNPNPSFSSSSISSAPSNKFLLPYAPTSLLPPSITSLSASSSALSNDEKKPLLECPGEDALSTPPCGGITKKKMTKAAFGAGELKGCAQKCELEALKKRKVISLDLEMELKDTKDVLDLELRLGYY